MKFRKKPVVIDAIQFDAEMPKEFRDQLCDCLEVKQNGWHIHTLEGTSYRLQIGDWIIKGVAGEFYPIREDIFLETYEPYEMTYKLINEQHD